jgi:hypothetical protein
MKMENTIAVKIKMQNGQHKTGVVLIDKIEGIIQNGYLKFVSNNHYQNFISTGNTAFIELLPSNNVHAVDSNLK